MKKKIVIMCFPLAVFTVSFFILVLGVVSGGNETKVAGDLGSGCSVITGSYNADLVDSVLKDAGAFAGQRTAFEYVGKKYNVDPILLIAISLHETGWGKSAAVINHNNPSGQMKGSTIIHFATLEEGLDMTGQTLNNLWNERGLNTIEKLSSAYAPIGAANDPTGLNVYWVPTVTSMIEQLGGLSGGVTGGGCTSTIQVSSAGLDHLQSLLGRSIGNGQCYALSAEYSGFMGGAGLGAGTSYGLSHVIGSTESASDIGSAYNWSALSWTVIKHPTYDQLVPGAIINWSRGGQVASWSASAVWGHTGVIHGLSNGNILTYEQNTEKGQIVATFERPYNGPNSIASIVIPPDTK
ncbi:hypothetical protein IGI96_002987 [Enterococcus sp. DIV0421]